MRDVQAAGDIRVALHADSFLNILRDKGDMPVRFVFERRADRAAAGMPEHEHELAAEMRNGVFHAADLMAVKYVPRNADDEQIADLGVKDLLRDHARIRAADHDRIRVLSVLRGVQTQRFVPVRHIMPVAFGHSLDDIHVPALPVLCQYSTKAALCATVSVFSVVTAILSVDYFV